MLQQHVGAQEAQQFTVRLFLRFLRKEYHSCLDVNQAGKVENPPVIRNIFSGDGD